MDALQCNNISQSGKHAAYNLYVLDRREWWRLHEPGEISSALFRVCLVLNLMPMTDVKMLRMPNGNGHIALLPHDGGYLSAQTWPQHGKIRITIESSFPFPAGDAGLFLSARFGARVTTEKMGWHSWPREDIDESSNGE